MSEQPHRNGEWGQARASSRPSLHAHQKGEKAGCWEAPPGGGTGIAGIWRAVEKNLGDGHLPCPRGTIGGCRQRARETGSPITAAFSGEEDGGGHWLKVRWCLTRPQRQ